MCPTDAPTHPARCGKGFPEGWRRDAGKGIPPPDQGKARHQRMRGLDRADLMRQLVFVNFVVDAAWGDAEEVSRLRLIALRLV